VIFWKTTSDSSGPDCFALEGAFSRASPENAVRFGLPEAGWVLIGAVARPQSRGVVRLTGASPDDPIQIESNALSHPEDLQARSLVWKRYARLVTRRPCGRSLGGKSCRATSRAPT